MPKVATNKLVEAGVTTVHNKRKGGPLWAGPESDADNGGVTQSLLGRFFVCPERFRLLVVEGFKTEDRFNHRMEYGNFWHVCEEAFAESGNPIVSNPVVNPPWLKALTTYAANCAARYRMQAEEVEHWYNVCKLQFPLYVDWWQHHQDVQKRTPIFQEQVFQVPYTLPSGRIVYLRGKWDSVDLIEEPPVGIYLQENKSKGDIDHIQLQRQLKYDLQTMFYLVALCQSEHAPTNFTNKPIRGVRYNVIRRPLSGGRGTIKQHAPTKKNPEGETTAQFYRRVAEMIEKAHGSEWKLPENEHHFFMRWRVEVTPTDIQRFRKECLDPILERLCDWWDHISSGGNPFDCCNLERDTMVHYRYPFGVYNPLDEGGSSEFDSHLESGSITGLRRATTLFPELE